MLRPKMVKSNRNMSPERPYVELMVSTWSKDSHALYDYQASDANKFYNEPFDLTTSTKVYRHVTTMRTNVQDDKDKKELPMESIYIATLTMDQNKKNFKVQSADVSGVLPHPMIRQNYPDLFKNTFLVIRDFEPDPGFEGYPLQSGNTIRLGRIEYLIIEVRNKDKTSTLKETTHLVLNKGTYEVENLLVGSCKICLCEESTDDDPLINPCNCKGSCELIHANCLRNWINSKVKKELNGIAVTYNFSKFECQICKTLFPKAVKLKNGDELEMITLEKPDKPYILLESVYDKNEVREDKKERNLHLISPEENSTVKLGRGHQCQIRITDISVSRTHAEMRFENNKFYLKDLKSKFGTLVKFREEYELKDKLKLQYGRTCFTFTMMKEQTMEDLAKKLDERPVFMTRAQREALGENEDDDEEGEDYY